MRTPGVSRATTSRGNVRTAAPCEGSEMRSRLHVALVLSALIVLVTVHAGYLVTEVVSDAREASAVSDACPRAAHDCICSSAETCDPGCGCLGQVAASREAACCGRAPAATEESCSGPVWAASCCSGQGVPQVSAVPTTIRMSLPAHPYRMHLLCEGETVRQPRQALLHQLYEAPPDKVPIILL